MIPEESCPLSRAHIALLEMCRTCGSTRTKDLADRLCLSNRTVEHRFAEIEAIMGVHDRASAIFKALDAGWIAATGRDSRTDLEEEK